MTSPQLPSALVAQLRPLVPDAPRPALSAGRGPRGGRAPRLSGARSSAAPHSRHPARSAAGHLHRNPGPQPSAPGLAGRCHNNRALAAEAAGEEVTSGGLAVVGPRDPGSILTGQTAEKELGERGGPGARASELETAGGRGAGSGAGQAGRPGRRAAEARGLRGSGARRAGRGAERRRRSGAAAEAGVDGHRGAGEPRRGCSLGPPWSPNAAPGQLRAAHRFRRPCASRSLRLGV